MAKLLIENINSIQCDPKVIKESIDKRQPILLKTILQRCDEQNANKRIYPRRILEREDRNYQKAIAENRATGHLDHSDSSVIELQQVSHVIRETHWVGNELHGTVQILNTPNGKIAQDLLADGITLGISSRGVGETMKDESTGADIVDESFVLIAYDLVGEPSTRNAYLHENKQLTENEIRKILTKNDRVNRIVNSILLRS